MDLEKIAKKNGLDIIETTSSSNGYPSNVGKAIIGFNSFSQAEELAVKYNLELAQFNKRDGWHFWFRTGAGVNEPYNNSAEDYGDNHSGFLKMEEEDFLESEVNWFFENGPECFDQIDAFIKTKREIWEQIKKMEDDEMVITFEGNYMETIKRKSMYFYHDTKHMVIGLQEK